jgi:hypothetical protein
LLVNDNLLDGLLCELVCLFMMAFAAGYRCSLIIVMCRAIMDVLLGGLFMSFCVSL